MEPLGFYTQCPTYNEKLLVIKEARLYDRNQGKKQETEADPQMIQTGLAHKGFK